MKIQRILSLLALATLLASCGGGGGGGSANITPVVPPPDPPAQFGGLWAGTMTLDNSGPTTDIFVAFVTEDGQFRFVSADVPLQYAGMQTTDVGAVSGTGQGFSELGFLDGSFVTTFTYEGTVIERDSFSGTWSTTAGDQGSFEFFYEPEYERPSSLALLEGAWNVYDDLGNATATFSFDALGAFNGQNTAGCSSLGMAMLADSRYNIYLVNSTITGCPLAGDYSGLAVLGDVNGTNDAMILAINSNIRALLVGLQK